MAKKQKPQGGGGAPDWLVTFADLMSLLVCFFVLIISFSIQDKEKLQVVAGSMREAFGVKDTSRKTGIIEVEGIPIRDYMKDISQVEQEMDSDFSQVRHEQRRKQGPEANTHDTLEADIEKPRQFATAAASLRQAWQEMPEITEISSNIILEESEDGLNIMLVDQDGRSMFREGSKYPYETTRRLIAKMAPGAVADAKSHRDYRSHDCRPTVHRSKLYRLGAVQRTRQCRPADPVRIRRAGQSVLLSGRQGRHRTIVPQRPLPGGKPQDRHSAQG